MGANTHHDYFSLRGGGSSLTSEHYSFSGHPEVPEARHHIRAFWNFTGHPEAIAEGYNRNTFPRPLGRGIKGEGQGCDKTVSEAHRKFLVPYCLSNLVSSKKAAFTLAEVLITLAIIGVVAAMTIPTLIANYQEKQTVSRLTKAYATISNAYQMAKIENGELFAWGFKENSAKETDPDTGDYEIADSAIENSNLFWAKVVPYLKVVKHTDTTKDNYQFETYTLDGRKTDILTLSVVELADGTAFFGGYIGDYKCIDKCGDFGVDINGINTKPNTLGKDIFYFDITKNMIKPKGKIDNQPFDEYCNISITTSNYNGYGCTAWVLYKKNMNYLKCSDPDWNGKGSCN